VLFEWDDDKRLLNIAKHGIDFRDAMAIWEGVVLEVPSSQSGHDERRQLAFGRMKGRIVAIVFVRRGERTRIISARGTRRYEREAYESAIRRSS
jgi:uncharacterized protein